jgi:hypothetical protein
MPDWNALCGWCGKNRVGGYFFPGTPYEVGVCDECVLKAFAPKEQPRPTEEDVERVLEDAHQQVDAERAEWRRKLPTWDKHLERLRFTV